MDMRLGSGQLVSEELMTLGESLSQTSDPSLKLFQCAVCNRFTTDNLDVLGLHMSAERSLPEEEWRAVLGDSHQCKLCHYTTQLKANFQLHCKTDKHVQKYQLVAHIKEGGKGNEWRLKCVAIGNPVHLKCNACDYYTNSLEKLRMHTVNSRHEASLKLYKVRKRLYRSPPQPLNLSSFCGSFLPFVLSFLHFYLFIELLSLPFLNLSSPLLPLSTRPPFMAL